MKKYILIVNKFQIKRRYIFWKVEIFKLSTIYILEVKDDETAKAKARQIVQEITMTDKDIYKINSLHKIENVETKWENIDTKQYKEIPKQ